MSVSTCPLWWSGRAQPVQWRLCESVKTGSWAVKKGRHRRYEEARKFKRSQVDDLQGLIESFNEPDDYVKPEHASWAEEFADEELAEAEFAADDD